MKKYILITILFILTAIFISSCCPATKYYDIKEKDKLSFNLNDTFIYKSNLNNYDTLVIEEITDEFVYKETSEALFCATEFYVEKMTYYLNNLNEPFENDKRPYLSLVYDDDENETNFSASFGRPPGRQAYSLDIGAYYNSDNTYFNVEYVLCYTCTEDSAVYKYFYNKENGFLTYEYLYGEQFNLINYIPKK
ncbi:MAG: hypothetical protein L3J35_13110 [Bacteroidales bacterium]|nr:hypothetical protein [Bacteroidales bacterium]